MRETWVAVLLASGSARAAELADGLASGGSVTVNAAVFALAQTLLVWGLAEASRALAARRRRRARRVLEERTEEPPTP